MPDRLRVAPGGEHPADERAHAAAANPVNLDSRRDQFGQDADVSEPSRPAAREHEPDGPPREPAGKRLH